MTRSTCFVCSSFGMSEHKFVRFSIFGKSQNLFLNIFNEKIQWKKRENAFECKLNIRLSSTKAFATKRFSLKSRQCSSSAAYFLSALLCNLCFSSFSHVVAWSTCSQHKKNWEEESRRCHLKLFSYFPSFLHFTRAGKCSRKVYKIFRPWQWNLHSCSNRWIVRLPFKFLFLESFPFSFVQHRVQHLSRSVCGSFVSRRSTVQHRENKFPRLIQ